ncbi:MAG: sensor histidine kinase [Anaerolineae bacterium]|nr:MAG: sensor histidine kinase [Anaerolineae bacterium]
MSRIVPRPPFTPSGGDGFNCTITVHHGRIIMAVEEAKNISRSDRSLEEFLSDVLEETQESLKDLDIKLQQSQVEVNRLTERNATVTAHLQKIQKQADALLPLEVREAYANALDVQQRLFLMRGQIERLNGEKRSLERLLDVVEQIRQMLEEGEGRGLSGETFSMVEAIIQAQEAERQRLSRQMHDGPAQALSNFILQAEIAMRLFDIDPEQAREELNLLKQSASATFQQVRNFVFELRPMMLDDLGLIPTLKRYVEAVKEQTGMQIDLEITGVERRLESYAEVVIFRSIQDLLSFVQHQGQATRASIQVAIQDANVRVVIEDNGKSFTYEEALEAGGIALKTLKERVEMLGGYLEVSASRPEGGTVIFQIPVSVAEQTVFTDL